MTRTTLYLLLPMRIARPVSRLARLPQTLGPYVNVTTLEGAHQVLARGPVASQEAIKLLSGDGGGILNANSAHPFENSTASPNFRVLLIFLIGAALTNTFGRWSAISGKAGHCSRPWGSCSLPGWRSSMPTSPPPVGASSALGDRHQPGGNMEGKEVRFGIVQSALFATATTASSDGAVNAMHDSFMPLSGFALMADMMLDEVIVGGPGSGLFGIVLFDHRRLRRGLMIGRTPEYIGKKIEANEVKMAMLALCACRRSSWVSPPWRRCCQRAWPP